MPTKSTQFTNGTLYLGDPETGEILGEISDVTVTITEEPESENMIDPIHLGGKLQLPVKSIEMLFCR